jgi:hypothetical protein|tara:strand:+ start:70 stop:765 length:696 start_codon:yes stop_codon:yes gene_type:complete
MKKIKYDLNYIIKNINIKKFLKFLKKDCLYEGGGESSIINYAIVSCATTKNTASFLIDDCFLKTYPNKFLNEVAVYEINGTLLNKINSSFKKIYHFELRKKGGKKKEIESHTLYQFKDSLNNLFFYIINIREGDLINYVVKFFKPKIANKMNIEAFIEEIINFKYKRQIAETEPLTSMLYEKPKNLFNDFINNKTGNNLLTEYNIVDVYAPFEDEEIASYKKGSKNKSGFN